MVATKLTNIANDIVTLLLPRVCFGCNTKLYRGEQYLCTLCRHDLPLTEYTFNVENPIDRIFYGRINVKKANSFLFFTKQGIVKQLIHHLKYKGAEKIGSFIGDWFGKEIAKNNHLPQIDYVIPVPLHQKRYRSRGYNQTTLFAKALAKHLDSTYLDTALIKTANTKTQTKKSRWRRWQDNQQLYKTKNAQLLTNANILLVDDVITTGATMELCASELLEIPGTTVFIASMAISV